MEEEKLIKERTNQVFNFIKQYYSWISYLILAIIVYISVKIRTSNLAGLRDISTGGWTLGPDLDPFLFLRWAKYIVANGSLYAHDVMRYVPLGFNTKGEVILLPYLIAWFHKVAVSFGSVSVDQSAAIFPVFMFAITVIAFFLFVRKAFVKSLGNINANIVALLSSLFFSIIPIILPRTIAGIPEKESAAFFFMFLAFYLFLSSWQSKKVKYQISLAILSGIATAMMALVWGGYTFIFVTLGLSFLISFLIGQFDKNKLYISLSWLLSSTIIMNVFSTRYKVSTLINSTTTLIPIAVLAIIVVHLLIFNTKLKKYFETKNIEKIPKPVISILVVLILGIVAGSIFFGINFIPDKIGDIARIIVTPVSDRLGVTVAENRQPYFNEWADSFGPNILGKIPLFFWLFFIGSIYLYSKMMSVFPKKERIITTLGYAIFLVAIIFSRYKPDSTLNGTNTLSLILYLIGIICLIGSFGKYYYKYTKAGEQEKIKVIDFSLIVIFSLFFLSIVSARGAVRLILMLVAPASIMASYFAVALFNDTKNMKNQSNKKFLWIIFIITIISMLFAANYFYKSSISTAEPYAPNIYTQQWQKAMSWVRENTPETAVFAHWWDYGYWVQSIGERATVLDGGNTIPYWNYLMGRYALTGSDSLETIRFFYSHNVTHFLIDSSDIGKYPAFSSIGSDASYDRYSWISSFVLDESQSQERKNSTLFFYSGGVNIDEDIIYDLNGTRVFIPANKAGLGAILIEQDSLGNIVSQPEGIFVYQSNQYKLPLRYAFDSSFHDFGMGVKSGVFLMPSLSQSQNGIDIKTNGALLYLSNRTVKSQLARLYLYKENDSYFKLAHSEDDFVVSQIKAQQPLSSDFIFFNGIRGPIRIWEINYPEGLEVNPVFLQKSYPNPELANSR